MPNRNADAEPAAAISCVAERHDVEDVLIALDDITWDAIKVPDTS